MFKMVKMVKDGKGEGPLLLTTLKCLLLTKQLCLSIDEDQTRPTPGQDRFKSVQSQASIRLSMFATLRDNWVKNVQINSSRNVVAISATYLCS